MQCAPVKPPFKASSRITMQLLAKRLSLGYAVGLYVYIGVLSVVSASNRNDHPERGVKLIFRYPDVRARPALSESVLGESRDNATTKRVYGVIECYDCETLEAIRRLLILPGEARRNVALLLLNGFHSSFLEYCKAIHSPLRIVVPVRLNKESSLRRSCRLPDLTWYEAYTSGKEGKRSFWPCSTSSKKRSRRIWSLAAKASLIAFTGVYYSVLGGAYSSLSKANVSYVSARVKYIVPKLVDS